MKTPCPSCGKTHDDLPLDIAFRKPGAYVHTPTKHRETAWQVEPDIAVFKGNRFFIRGCLFLPLTDSDDSFTWGLWAEVSNHVFVRYRELFDADGSREPVYSGALSVEHETHFRGIDQLPVSVQFGPVTKRPLFHLKPSNHWLYRYQVDGINLHRVQQILHALFPKQF